MNKLDSLIKRRTDKRRETALAIASSVLRDAAEQDIDIALVGSLAKKRFRSHSDVDLLVRGAVDPERRSRIERLVAGHFREANLPYDLIFAADVTPERLQELLDDVV